jgi:hypothetical protein
LQATLTLTPRADSPLGSPLIDLKCGSADCGYAFPATIGKLPRLDFAVYGPCASGKTTWLALAHEQWSASEPAPGAIIKPVCTEAAGTLDDLARQVLVDKKSPAPTAAPAIPEPLLYHVVDRDALAASHVVMNLFDFPGDIAQPHNVARNDASFRALSMRGFLYFFDPTGPIDVQFQSLVAFCQALRERAGLDVDAQLLVPIAVCVTKLDRLPETPLQKTAFPWLAELRKTERQPLSLALLRARSDLVRRILVELSQGYPLAEELDRAFGGNYLFFPQSNFGVQEEELGLPLQQRGALTSFGTFEPVWWLLHRNGLQMF